MLKTRTERLLALNVAFLVGCGASHVAGSFHVREARADAPAQRFEYNCIRATEGITDAANKLGEEGWELSAAAASGTLSAGWGSQSMVWCFKRRLGAAPRQSSSD
jgi:hypothetical protein